MWLWMVVRIVAMMVVTMVVMGVVVYGGHLCVGGGGDGENLYVN